MVSQKDVFLVDFEAYRPPEELGLSVSYGRQYQIAQQFMEDDQLEYMISTLKTSGIGEKAFLCPSHLEEELELNVEKSKEEAKLMMCGAVEGLLRKTGVRPDQIVVVVTACSVFNTMPSLSTMVMNHFKMKPDTMYYHLGGMGCAAGISAPALAAKLLGSCRKKGYAIVVMHENITNNVYTGKDPSFLHSSVIARLGGSAVLLSTEPEERCNAKYVLEHVVRSVTAADSEATEYCHLTLDGEKNLGVYTPPAEKVQEIAAGAVKLTMRQLASEMGPGGKWSRLGNGLFKPKTQKRNNPMPTSDILKVCEHIIIHPGAHDMIENVAKSLRLPIETQEPSMNALYWYGNTSSSSIWYAAGWAETVKGIKKGERMMQLGLGAGFESNASVWRALRDIDTPHNAWKHVLGGAEGEAKDVFMRVCRGEATGSSTLLIKQDIMARKAAAEAPGSSSPEPLESSASSSVASEPQVYKTPGKNDHYPYVHPMGHVVIPMRAARVLVA